MKVKDLNPVQLDQLRTILYNERDKLLEDIHNMTSKILHNKQLIKNIEGKIILVQEAQVTAADNIVKRILVADCC